ncbi:MAG TPA: hypothetical protein VNX15_00600 [Gemmatimonadales bacterium]|jgi:hypothetical protein|nr:hypothetical protein [Gemmatimonadales bacterium]
MLVSSLPPPPARPRLAHRAAILDAVAAARCALKLTLCRPDDRLSRELLQTAVEQLDLVRGSVERLA